MVKSLQFSWDQLWDSPQKMTEKSRFSPRCHDQETWFSWFGLGVYRLHVPSCFANVAKQVTFRWRIPLVG